MKFGKKLRRAESNFNQTIGLELSFISYKNLKKQLKQTLENFKSWQDLSNGVVGGTGPTVHAENLYLESAEKFMGMLCQDILEIAWVYDSHIKNCTQEQRFYLQAYAFLNTEAVRKICKKFDKHVIGEDILGSMMKRLKTQNFFRDIQSLGPYEVGALRQVLVGEGFEDETLPWLSTGAWPQKGDENDFVRASLVNNKWKSNRQEGEWPNGIPDFTVSVDDVSFLDNLPETLKLSDDRSIASDVTDGRESDGELEYAVKPAKKTFAQASGFVKKDPARYDAPTNRAFDATPPLPKPQQNLPYNPRATGFGPVSRGQHYDARVSGFGPKPQQYIQQQNTWGTDRVPFGHREARPFQQPKPQAMHNNCIDPVNQNDANIGNLIVNYLPNEWSEIELLAMFSPFGEILSARVIRERFSRRSKGFGFVKFTTDDAAEEAIQALNGEIACGKRIKVAFAKPRKSRAKANLFVSRFPSDWTSVALKRLFVAYGDIVECRVLRTIEGESKRCGFVRFSNEEDALQAILALNSCILPGEKARLRVKVADRERYQQYKSGNSRR